MAITIVVLIRFDSQDIIVTNKQAPFALAPAVTDPTDRDCTLALVLETIDSWAPASLVTPALA